MAQIISIDPGTHKCGLLLSDVEKRIVIDAKITREYAVIDLITKWSNEYSIELILIGNGTNSRYWHSKILNMNLSQIQIVDERATTLRARDRYWEIFPPGFFLKLLPKGMLVPKKNLDTIAALILLEDYLQTKINWSEKISFKTWPEQ